MTETARCAVYFAPESGGPLAAFGAAWLGWDAEARAPVAHPKIAGLPMAIADVTRAPRKYGFHGTLKPPFRLAPGLGRAELEDAVAAFAARWPAFEVPALKPTVFDRFLALAPGAPCAELAALAFACVSGFDRFRAPPSQAELARRRRTPLTPRREALLRRWGYPYVDDEFRFHLTLTGALPPDALAAVAAALAPAVAPLCAAPLPMREICLFEEGDNGRFHIVGRFPLAG